MSTNMIVIPQSQSGLAPQSSDSIALENLRAVKGVPGVLYGLSGYHAGPAQFIQVHDKATAPATNDVPKVVIPIAIGSTSQVPFSIDLGVYGMAFTKGIQVVNSLTGPLYAAGATDCWFNARYK